MKTIESVFDQVSAFKFSRIPLVVQDINDCTGFVLKSDVLLAHAKGENSTLESLQRSLDCVTEHLTLPVLLKHMVSKQPPHGFSSK